MSNQSGKLMPNLDQQSTKLLNLTVLQRIDPFIEEILITAAHVTLYGFNIDLNQWSRKDVEGSLFVIKRNTQPRFQFVVMNRRNTGHFSCSLIMTLSWNNNSFIALTSFSLSTENLVENLLGDFEFELQVPYLLYRNASQEVNGIWFYNSHECEDVANLFTRILNAYAKVPPKLKTSSNKSEFEELEAVPTSAVIEGPLEPSFTTSTSTGVPDDSSFVNFFSAAMNIGHDASNVVNSGQHGAIPISSRVPNVVPSPAPTLQIPPLPFSASSTSPMLLTDAPDPINNNNRVTNLLKPSSFFTPPSSSSALLTPLISSSMPTAVLQPPPLNLQGSHGTPMLQPFPPPTPPISLTPSSSPSHYGPLTRDQVREALLILVQDNQFIDMLYQALLKGHQS